MNLATYETLKIGDIVSPNRGKNKGEKCIVKDIWGIMVCANFLNTNLRVKGKCWDVFVSYRGLTKE